MRALITGGAGFIGHHLAEHLLKATEWDLILLDRLTYASCGYNRLRENRVFGSDRTRLFTHDCAQRISEGLAQEIGPLDVILHLAAETHVDNSIRDPVPFVRANVLGTMEMLEFARRLNPMPHFVYFSTDEVFGPAPDGIRYEEWDRYNSTNPYAAAKAGGEELCLAWANTYGLPVTVTHCMNVFGERQHVEKFIPGTIRRILGDEEVTIHADSSLTASGSRFYIHARNVAAAILFLLSQPLEVRQKYNIVGEREMTNLGLAQAIAGFLGKPLRFRMVNWHSSRPGHDLRYALSGDKMQSLGWEIPVSFERSLERTIAWTLRNPQWLQSESHGIRGSLRQIIPAFEG
jgi:dTDP-glucose 4,6-dehydratase